MRNRLVEALLREGVSPTDVIHVFQLGPGWVAGVVVGGKIEKLSDIPMARSKPAVVKAVKARYPNNQIDDRPWRPGGY